MHYLKLRFSRICIRIWLNSVATNFNIISKELNNKRRGNLSWLSFSDVEWCPHIRITLEGGPRVLLLYFWRFQVRLLIFEEGSRYWSPDLTFTPCPNCLVFSFTKTFKIYLISFEFFSEIFVREMAITNYKDFFSLCLSWSISFFTFWVDFKPTDGCCIQLVATLNRSWFSGSYSLRN